MATQPDTSPRPLSFSDGLTLLFIGLRLTHQINWNWVWVVSPFVAAAIIRTILDKEG